MLSTESNTTARVAYTIGVFMAAVASVEGLAGLVFDRLRPFLFGSAAGTAVLSVVLIVGAVLMARSSANR